ncbi:MAG: gliding motility-associated C-terminal domain-containing protein [Ferruginibacter sp.]
MRKFLLLGAFLFPIILQAQVTSFSFSCTHDTLIPCTVPCITLKARIPDLHGLSSSYTINPVSGAPNGCYTPYVPPDAPGNPTALNIDDTYSGVIPIGFNFPFFGTYYPSLVASANGYLSFDISLAGQFSHYSVTNNLPSNVYDPAIIMGPYHDLDPSIRSNPPPEMQIKYDLVGTAPYRRWILSFYHVPLYSSNALTCGQLNLNTHQIILYESTGIIEVMIQNKQICSVWNNGKAMVGIQDMTQLNGMTVPTRGATDPPWGSVGMNESWRFVPNGGPSLFKDVKLYDLAGNPVSTGVTTNLGNGIIDVSFPGVCPATSPATYIVKSTYQKIDDPLTDIYGTDTVTVTRDNSMPMLVSTSDPVCKGGNGTITVTDPVGPVYEYSIDGVNWQLSPVFSVPAGTYTVRVRITGTFCGGNTPVTLADPPPIPITANATLAKCKGTATGSIAITAPLGTDYEYSLDNGVTWQSSPVFNNLMAGNYTITLRQISINCTSTQTITVGEPALLTATAQVLLPASCANNDGSIGITAAGGTPAYEYSIDNGTTWSPSGTIGNLPAGTYAGIKVRDINGCTTNANAVTVQLNDTMRLELGPDTTICVGKSITLIPQTNAQTDTFKWTPLTWLDYDTAKTPIATPQDTIKYYLLAKWGVCQRRDSITVNVLHKPVPFAGNDTTVCFKTNAFLHGIALNTSGPVNYSWAPPDSLNTPNAATTIARIDTTRQFFLTVTDNYGCNFSTTDSMWVFMQPVVPAFAGNDTIAWANKPHQMHATGGLFYLWTPATPLNNPFIQDPVALLNNDTYFTVLVTDAIGCQAEDGVFIKVYQGPEYYMPNTFTPNGDGLNDRFRPIPPGMKTTVYFRVFNRMGQLVFETNKWMEGWDGKFKGKDSPMGAYVWEVKGYDANGRVVQLQGTVTLLR